MDATGMTTNRTPIERPTLTTISLRAIELFGELERARRARKNATDCKLGGPQDFCKAECRACRLWWDAHAALHTELGLEPWNWPALPHCPLPPGSGRARAWRPGTEQKKLYDLLREARRAANAAKRTASSQDRLNPV
jgi:hypothetical protein